MVRLKQVILWCLGIGLLLSVNVGTALAMTPVAGEFTAGSAILVDIDSGRVLWEKNPDRLIYPASTTKIMTAIVALESGQANDIVTVGVNAAGTEGSSMELLAGDRVAMFNLLTGMLVVSGNDASIAIAEQVAGSVSGFAELMNKKARSLGAFHTHFANSCGLPDPNHYTTTRDLARIAAYAYSKPTIRLITATQQRSLVWRINQPPAILENTNLLLGKYQGVNGMKTGYTMAAGECLVATAERDGKNLMAIVMGCATDYRWDEAARLLDYGFKSGYKANIPHSNIYNQIP